MAIWKLTLVCLIGACMPCVSPAGIISDGLIGGYDDVFPSGDGGLVATGQYVEDHIKTGPGGGNFSDEAYITTDGIKLKLTSRSGTFSGLTGGVVDTYTLLGGSPGATVTLNAHLRIAGNSRTLPTGISGTPYYGNSRILYGVGLLLNSANAGIAAVANPVIDDPRGFIADDFAVVHGATGETSASTALQDVDFDQDIVIPLRVTEGEAFQLAISVGIKHVAIVETNMLNTATLSFDLPTGFQISSTQGFGAPSTTTEDVPEPSSLALFGLGTLGLFGWRRRRQG